MTLKPWEKIKQKNKISNKWWTYFTDEVMLPNGNIGEYHYVHTNGSSLVIPIYDDGKILMVRQFRYLGNRESIEFPCGSIKEESTYEETAINELAEEAGVEAEEIIYVGEFNPYNGVTSEMCKVYIARKLKTIPATPDDTEEFESIFLSKEEIDLKIKSNEIWDGMTMAAWLIAKDHL